MKKKKKSFLRKFFETGIPILPVIVLAEWMILPYIRGIPPDELPYIPESSEWALMIGFAMIPVLLIWTENAKNIKKLNEKDGREIAKRPPAPADMLFKVPPPGFTFGKYKGRYVCLDLTNPHGGTNVLVEGATGSGKSASIIQSFLLNPKNRQTCTALVTDLKSELRSKCLAPEDIYSPQSPNGNSKIIDPVSRTRDTYGFDPFYSLSDTSTESEVHEVMTVVAQSLIPPQKYGDRVWSDSARQLLRSCLTYFFYHEGVRTLPEIIIKIKEMDIEALVQKIVSNSAPGSTTYVDAISFFRMASETITSVNMTLSNHIVQFATDQNLVWALSKNPRKASPEDLLQYNLFLCLSEDKITSWSNFVLLLYNSCLHWLSTLPESDLEPTRKHIVLLFDELGSLVAGIEGSIPLLASALRLFCRSKNASCVCCLQSISQLNEYFGRDLAADILMNLNYRYYLSCNDPTEAKNICTMAGKYMKRRVTASGAGTQRKDSTSYSDEEILTEAELVTLPRDEEVVLLSERAGYLRLEKVYVFRDEFFKPLLQGVKEKWEALKK